MARRECHGGGATGRGRGNERRGEVKGSVGVLQVRGIEGVLTGGDTNSVSAELAGDGEDRPVRRSGGFNPKSTEGF